MTGVQFPVGVIMGFSSPRHRIQTGFGAHAAFYPLGTGGSYSGCKATGAYRSPPYSAEVKNGWRYISIPLIRLHGMMLN